jgi:WD40 repeat protein
MCCCCISRSEIVFAFACFSLRLSFFALFLSALSIREGNNRLVGNGKGNGYGGGRIAGRGNAYGGGGGGGGSCITGESGGGGSSEDDDDDDGTLLISGSPDGTVCIWSLATGERLATLSAQIIFVSALDVDGVRCVCGSGCKWLICDI